MRHLDTIIQAVNFRQPTNFCHNLTKCNIDLHFTSNTIQGIIAHLAEDIEQFNWKTFVMGMGCLGFILVLKSMSLNERLNERYSWTRWLGALSPILTTIVMIILSYTLDFDHHSIPIVGEIPPGLPPVTITWRTPLSHELVVITISSVIVSFVQSIAVTKRIAYKRGYKVDSSQELISIGLVNILGSMFGSYLTMGAFAQSAVSDEVGAETGFASRITGIVVMAVLLLLTPVFEYMPLAVLAAIVIAFVSPMFNYKEAKYLYYNFFDFVVWNCAMFGTLFFGVTYGLAISVGLSLLFVIYESAYPQTAVLGRLPGTSLYHNVKQYPSMKRYNGVAIIHIDAPMGFANAQNVRDKVHKYKNKALAELRERNAGEHIRYLIFDLSPVSHIDTTALQILEDMYVMQKKVGTQICFCNPGITVIERFVRSGLVDLFGQEHFFSAVIDTVECCLTDMESLVH